MIIESAELIQPCTCTVCKHIIIIVEFIQFNFPSIGSFDLKVGGAEVNTAS